MGNGTARPHSSHSAKPRRLLKTSANKAAAEENTGGVASGLR